MRSGSVDHNFPGSLRAAVCFLVIGAFVSIAFSSGYAADLSLEYRSEKLSGDISKVPLRTILTVLSEKTGITVYLDPSLKSKRISASFTDLPLVDGIKKLISPYSSAVVYGKKTGADGKAVFHVAELKVFDRGKEDASFMLIGKTKPSESGTISKPVEDRGTIPRDQRFSSIPDRVKDPARAAAYHKKVNASVLRSRIRQTMARIRSLEHKMRYESELRRRDIREVEEALQNASEDESKRMQAKLAMHKSEMTNMNDRDSNEMMQLRRELDQLKKRQVVVETSLAGNADKISSN